MLRRGSELLTAIGLSSGLFACVMSNPAFDEDRATAADGSSTSDPTTSAPESGDESSATTDDPTDTDTNDTGTSDTTDTDTTDTGPDPTCEFLARPALRLTIQPPEGAACPPTVGELFLRLELTDLNTPTGVAVGLVCGDPTCDVECSNALYAVGAPGFAGLAQVWTALGQVAEAEAIQALCVEVAANNLVGMQDGECVYESLGIFDNTIEHGPVFVGNVDNAPQTWIGQIALAQKPPPILANEPLGACSCETVHDSLAERQCCEAAGVMPQFHALSYLDLIVEPGMSAPVTIESINWQFHAVQAQVVPSCVNAGAGVETSWALTRLD